MYKLELKSQVDLNSVGISKRQVTFELLFGNIGYVDSIQSTYKI